jgi:hypothetical protein
MEQIANGSESYKAETHRELHLAATDDIWAT